MTAVRRVFISYTSEFAKYPERRSFIDATVSGVIRAGCMPCDMEYFTARDQQPALYCIDRVRACDVYVGIIGLRYGSLVRDRPSVSYTELEFEAASMAPAKTRLIFLLAPNALVPADQFTDDEYGKRQKEFRKRLSDAGIICKLFSDFHELDKLVYQALNEESPISSRASQNEESPISSRASQKLECIDWPEGKSPYPGLDWFDEKYAPLFFGRDREVSELVGRMSEPAGRVLFVVGASGSGKSSVVAAGVWQAVIKQKRLREGVESVWLRIQPSDGDTPFDALARKMKDAWKLITRPDFTNKEATLRHLLARHLTQNQELILFIDHLEELFTSGFKESDIQAFWHQLINTALDKENRLRVIATIRSEFIGNLEAYESTLDLLNSPYRYHLGPVSPLMLQEMLEKPANATGYSFEPGLIDRIVTDAGSEPGQLPLVAYALEQLFVRRRNTTFTVEAYNAIGGVVGAIGNKADEVLLGLSDEVREAFDRVFARLVHSDQESPPIRKRTMMSAFASDPPAEHLIGALAGPECRVLVTSRGGQEQFVEVAHEKLLDAWAFLANWLKESAVFLTWQQGLNGKIKDYGTSKQDRDLLLRGFSLTEALEWLKKKPYSLSQRERDFIHASENHHNNKKRTDRLYKFVVVVIVFALMVWSNLFQWKWHGYTEVRHIGLKVTSFFGSIDMQPQMVQLPGDTFQQGDVEELGEPSRKPVRPVKIKPFIMGKHEVTFEEYDRFAIAEGKPLPNDQGWGRGRHPVINVSRDDAKAYAQWISQQTGKHYRLPSESEWEYAARSGAKQQEWAGTSKESKLKDYAVFFENSENHTAEVGTKAPNEFGLYDLSGNVWEWVEDCAHATYVDAPKDGSAWLEDSGGKCDLRVIRGGAWTVLPENLRASNRVLLATGLRSGHLGFRLAQDIP